MEKRIIKIYKSFIDQFVEIPENDIVSLAAHAVNIFFKKDDFFCTPDKPSPYLSFVIKGLFRQYVIDKNGEEVIREFRGENNFMASYSAIIYNKFPPIYIQALEDSEIVATLRTDFLKMWEQDANWKILLQKHTELDYMKLMKRELSFLMDDVKTRYLAFLEDYKPFAERIKLRHVASYLGISPETLSRIRSSPYK